MSSTPRVRIEPDAIERRGDRWRASWWIANDGGSPLHVIEAWHPHGRFRSSRLRRSVIVAPRSSAMLELPAKVDARIGDVIENCFLILRAERGRKSWRILARFTVRLGAQGIPHRIVERVDVLPAEG